MIWIWNQGYGDEESILGYFGGLSIVTRCLIKRKTEGSESERGGVMIEIKVRVKRV